jgi:ankyrin repeat protein
MVRLLLKRGSKVNIQGGWDDNALSAAIYNGYETIARLLLDEGADVNASDGSALLRAAMCGSTSTALLLFNATATTNGHLAGLNSALYNAARLGHLPMCQLLLDKGADIDARDDEERSGTALQAAVCERQSDRQGNAQKVAQLLLGRGANINAPGGKYGNGFKPQSPVVLER